MLSKDDDAIAICALVQRRELSIPSRAAEPAYTHMGAMLGDAVLQSGVRYVNIVLPRVRRILEIYPEEKTTSAFARVLDDHGVGAVLMWNHHEKQQRLRSVVSLLLAECVESVFQFNDWLESPGSREELLALKGFGRKTVDYMKRLSGGDEIAVDRHIRGFAAEAGVRNDGYDHLNAVFKAVAAMLNVRVSDLDRAIWLHRSSARCR